MPRVDYSELSKSEVGLSAAEAGSRGALGRLDTRTLIHPAARRSSLLKESRNLVPTPTRTISSRAAFPMHNRTASS